MEEATPVEAISVPPIARIGDPVGVVDTPSLVIDLDTFEDNLRKMQALVERHGVALRPHAKAHKCPDISLRQIALGAQGICCQKVSEAVPFVAAGVRDIHISNEIVGANKLALLARVAAKAKVTVCADHPRAVEALSAAMAESGACVGVVVDADVGQKRCGVQTPEQAVALAQLIQKLPGITFAGLQAYHGAMQHTRCASRRRKSSARVARLVRTYLRALSSAGIECPVVTGGGTGSAVFDVASGVFTEIQAGSYPFMDAHYASLEWGEEVSFGNSLYLLGTVMSTPTAERAVADVGLKSTSAESGAPRPLEQVGWSCVGISDEHTVLQAGHARDLPTLGAQVRLVPGHCDPTFNLHDSVIAIRGQVVEAIWPISARGLSR